MPTVQNVQKNQAAGASVIITKPTGLAVGDLLVAVLFNFDTSERAFNTPSGWTVGVASFGNNNVVCAIVHKTATADDVAASNFTFSAAGSSDSVCGFLYRVTDHSAAFTDTISGIGAGASNAFTLTQNLDLILPNSLLIFACFKNDSEVDITARSVTGGTNPSWTDRGGYVDTSAVNSRAECADAIYDSTTQITAATFSPAVNLTTCGIAIVVITPQQDAPGTAALLAGAPAIFAPASSVSAPGTAALLVGTPTLAAPVSTVAAPNWTNADKTAAANVTNLDKS